MKTIYVADDGTQFYDERKCLLYEASKALEKGKGIIFGRDENGNELDYSSPSFIIDAAFIACKTPKAVELFNQRQDDEELGIDDIREPTAYYWDENILQWRYAQPCINYLNQRIRLLKRILNDLR